MHMLLESANVGVPQLALTMRVFPHSVEGRVCGYAHRLTRVVGPADLMSLLVMLFVKLTLAHLSGLPLDTVVTCHDFMVNLDG